MYTAHIGHRLLDLYNTHRRDGPPLSPRQFFDEVFFPLVFDDRRYLMWVNNSPFDQAYGRSTPAKPGSKKQVIPLTPDIRRQCLDALHEKIEEANGPYSHLFLGGIDQTVGAPTSSLVTDIKIDVATEDFYLSWIGAAAGIKVEGGFSILNDIDDVLLLLFEGWSAYRTYMNSTPSLKPHQIDTWNAWWLIHRLGRRYQPHDPLRDFKPNLKKTGDRHELVTASWIKVVLALAQEYPNTQSMIYVYTLSYKTMDCKTVGFIRLDLPEVNRLPILYEKLFGEHDRRDRDNLIEMYETQFGFRTACQQGSIGLRAIEPKNLRKYMPVRRDPGKLPTTPKREADEITFKIYQTWIIAMLNNDDLLRQAQQAAQALHAFTQQATRGKQTHKSLVNDVLTAGSSKTFVEKLTPILEEDGTHKELLNELVHSIVKMPTSTVPLFLALLRFKYAYVSA